MVLSIGMIVKNEEKYLRQCLAALQPLRDAVESELIIVDTGSTDSTVEIAREFTDKVLFFEWINDFSAARNVSLNAATGEWFMFIDGDEVFQSCNDLIHFFKSGEYKNFNSASYGVRSYENLNNRSVYTDCYVPRMVKRTSETTFEGVIHEKLVPSVFPKRLITDVADHYGYVFTGNKELLNEKFERNSKLLLERLEASNGEPSCSLCKELFDTYNFLDDKTQALEYARMGIEQAKKEKTDYIMALYYSVAFMRFCRHEYDELFELYDEYFAVDKEIRVKERSLDIEFYGFKALALYKLGRYEEAYDEFHKFFTLNNRFEKDGICTREALYVMRYFTNENAMMDLNLFYTETCLQLERFREAEENFKRLPIAKFEYQRTVKIMRLNQMIDYLRCTGSKALSAMYNTLEDSDRRIFFDAIRYRLHSWNKEEQQSMINKLVSMNFSKKSYNSLVQIYKQHIMGGGAGSERICNFISEFGAVNPDLLNIMMKEKLDITPYMTACADISNDISACFNNIAGFADVLRQYDTSAISSEDNLLNLTKLYLQAALSAAATGNEIQDFAAYAGSYSMKYLTAFGENNIPAEVLAAVTIEQVNMLRGMRNYKECVAALRQLIQIDRKYAPIAKVYQALIKADMGG